MDRDRTRSVGDLSWLGSTADGAAADDDADDSDAVNARCSRRDTTTDRHFHESHHLDDTRYRRPAAATRCSAKPNVSPPDCATSRLRPANRFHFSPHANTTHTHTHTRLTAPCPGLPGSAATRKVKPIWIFLKQETVSGSGIS